ncbi:MULTISPECIES: ParA family protein [unclassified Pyramidobacter]|uniref:ParA family protein n=2 Tax=unclassified Pyramidobacter TaxID=2632171 RepID=UPI00098F4E11|nr:MULTISPECIES: ParA family protein [unclassified Pyramidobacter]OON89595.1 hypothetical protein B0D78_03210 [Pyramidobacter sp. C12-8]
MHYNVNMSIHRLDGENMTILDSILKSIGLMRIRNLPPPPAPLPPQPLSEAEEEIPLSDEEREEVEQWAGWAAQMGDIVPQRLEVVEFDYEPSVPAADKATGAEEPVAAEDVPAQAEAAADEKSAADSGTRSAARAAQKRVAVSMLKGGVGKTTITCFIATAIQKIWDEEDRGERLLVVDTDPQGSATDFFLRAEDVPAELSLRALLDPQPYAGNPELLIRSTRYAHVDILPAHPSAADVLPAAEGALEDRLARFLDRAAREYRLVLIDTPPSATLALKNALLAADDVLLPIDPSRQCLKTLPHFSATLAEYKHRNPRLRICGVIFSRCDRRQRLDREILAAVTEQLAKSGIPLYEVPRRAAIADCYNRFLGVEGLEAREKEALTVFGDLAWQTLSLRD